MVPDESLTAKRFLFVNVLSEITAWCCYHLFYVMDCAYQLLLPEKMNTCALLLLKTRRKVFLRDEGSILGFVSVRLQVWFSFEQSECTLHCCPIIQESAECFPCGCLQQQATKGGTRWCTMAFPTPHTLAEATSTGASFKAILIRK